MGIQIKQLIRIPIRKTNQVSPWISLSWLSFVHVFGGGIGSYVNDWPGRPAFRVAGGGFSRKWNFIATENTTENVHPSKRYSSVFGRAPYVREIWVGEQIEGSGLPSEKNLGELGEFHPFPKRTHLRILRVLGFVIFIMVIFEDCKKVGCFWRFKMSRFVCWLFHTKNRVLPKSATYYLGGGFKSLLFSPLFGEDSHFGSYFSDGLKPPTSYVCTSIIDRNTWNRPDSNFWPSKVVSSAVSLEKDWWLVFRVVRSTEKATKRVDLTKVIYVGWKGFFQCIVVVPLQTSWLFSRPKKGMQFVFIWRHLQGTCVRSWCYRPQFH